MLCPECFKGNVDKAKRCYSCGYYFNKCLRYRSWAHKIIEIVVLFVILFNLYLTFEQGKLLKIQTELMIKEVNTLNITKIYQFADRAIWNYTDGGDYYSFESLYKFTDKFEYPKLSNIAKTQIYRISAANNNLYIIIDERSKTDVHWFPPDEKSEGFGMDVSTEHLIGLMSSKNHWLVRAGCAKLLGDVTREKIAKDISSDEESKIMATEDKIINALAERIKVDPSMGVIITALKALNKRQPENIHNFGGRREILKVIKEYDEGRKKQDAEE